MTRVPIQVFCFSANDGWNRFGCNRAGVMEADYGLCRSQTFEPAIADQSAHDRAVLLLDPSLIVLAVGPRPCDLQTVIAAPSDNRFVHEQAVIVKVDAGAAER